MGLNSISDHINDFNIILDNYIKEKEWSKFGEVIGNYFKKEIASLDQPEMDKVLQERSISMFYLDKMTTTHGKLHPDFEFLKEGFGGGHDFLASLELISILNHIKSDESLPAEAEELIDQWIMGEMTTLPLMGVVDYFKKYSIQDFKPSSDQLSRAEFETELKKFVGSGSQKKLNPNEVKMIAKQIVEQIKNLKPGGILKIPAGNLIHLSRIIIEKKEDNTNGADYTLLHSDTGLGRLIIGQTARIGQTASTLTEYQPQLPEKLEDPQFWEDFLNGTLHLKMDDINELLKSLNGKFRVTEDQKSTQEMGSCSVKSIENDLKHFIISHASNREVGFQIYKLIKSLMISKSKECIQESIHPYLKDMLIEKELIRKRYFAWVNICNDEQQFQEIKEAYLAAIRDLFSGKDEILSPTGKKSNEIVDLLMGKLNNNIKDLTNLQALQYLDKYADERASRLPGDALEKLRSKYSKQMTFEGTNYLCLRPTLWIKNNKDLLDEILSDTNIKNQVCKTSIQASKTFLPEYVTKKLQNELYTREMKKESLLTLLKEYAVRQDPLIAAEQLRQGLSNQKFLFSELTALENRVIETFVSNIDVDFLQNNLLNDPIDVPSIVFINKQINNLRHQQEEGRNCSLFTDYQLEKILELLAKTEVSEVKEMLQNLLGGVALERVKVLLHNGNVMKALETAYDSQYALKLIVDAHENAGGGLGALNTCIDTCKEEPFKSEFIADIGLIYLKRGQDKVALELASGIKERGQASRLLSALAEYYISNEEIDLAKMLISKESLGEQSYAEMNKKMAEYWGSQKNWNEIESYIGSVDSEEADSTLLQFESAFIQDQGFIAGVEWIEKINDPKVKKSAMMALMEHGKNLDFSDEQIDEIIARFKAVQNDEESDKLLNLFADMLFSKEKWVAGIRVTNQMGSENKYEVLANEIKSYSRCRFSGDDAVKIFEVLKEVSKGERNYFAAFLIINLNNYNPSEAKKLVELARTLKFESPSNAQRDSEYPFFRLDNSSSVLGIVRGINKPDRSYFAHYFLESMLRINPEEAKKFVEMAKKDLNIQFDESVLQV